MKPDLRTKCALFGSIDTAISRTFENAEPSIKLTQRGMAIDLRNAHENTCDSIRPNSEPVSNEIDESDSQYEKHDEPRI
jgi:hypothetical protein